MRRIQVDIDVDIDIEYRVSRLSIIYTSPGVWGDSVSQSASCFSAPLLFSASDAGDRGVQGEREERQAEARIAACCGRDAVFGDNSGDSRLHTVYLHDDLDVGDRDRTVVWCTYLLVSAESLKCLTFSLISKLQEPSWHRKCARKILGWKQNLDLRTWPLSQSCFSLWTWKGASWSHKSYKWRPNFTVFSPHLVVSIYTSVT